MQLSGVKGRSAESKFGILTGLTCACVCVDSTHSVVHLQLTLKRVDHAVAFTELLLENAYLMLESVDGFLVLLSVLFQL